MSFPTLSRFRYVRLLGRGSFGEVYEAEDQEGGGRVALKVLSLAEPERVRRFKQEFRSLALLSVPGVVSFRDLFEHEGQWFFTMDLVEGEDMLRWLHRSVSPAVRDQEETWFDMPGLASPTLPVATQSPDAWATLHPQQIRNLFARLAETVNALHSVDRIHRDLKPANILVTHTGDPQILDLGLVTDVGPAGSGTHSVAGTIPYMAPEMFRGHSSMASDWYAVGVILVEALCGHLPFEGSIGVVIDQKNDPSHLDPILSAPHLPEDLVQLARQLLNPDPYLRPSGAEIVQYLGGKEPHRSPITPGFFGRSAEMAALQGWLPLAQNGRPQLVVLSGESGIGKSALAQAFLDRIRPEPFVTLSTRCWPRESVSFKALDGVMDALCGWLSKRNVDAFLPWDVAPLAVLFPVLMKFPKVREAVHHAAELPHRRQRAAKALAELLGRIAAQTALVLVIDDIQWADTESGAFLADVLMAEPTPRLMLVLGCRPGEHAFLREFDVMTKAHGPIDLRRLEMGPLEGTAADALLRHLLADHPVDPLTTQNLLREAAGSPLFMSQLVAMRMDHADGPLGSLDSAIRLRGATFSTPSRAVLELVSVADGPVPLSVLRTTLQYLETNDDTGAIDALVRARLVVLEHTPTGARLSSAHDRFRETIAAGLESARKRQICGALAQSFIHHDAKEVPEIVASLLEQAERPAEAAPYWLAAADRAAGATAWSNAAELYRRAQKGMLETAQLRVARKGEAQALGACGRRADAARAYLKLAQESDGCDADRFRLEAGEHLVRSGRVADGLVQLRQVAEAAGYHLPENIVVALLFFAWERFRVWLRGYDYELQLSTDPATAWRLDVGATLMRSLMWVDLVRAQLVAATYLRVALKAGIPDHLVLALLGEETWLAQIQPGMLPRIQAPLNRAITAASPSTMLTVVFVHCLQAIGLSQHTEVQRLWGQWKGLLEGREDEASASRDRNLAVGLNATVQSGHFLEARQIIASTTHDARRVGDELCLRGLSGSPAAIVNYMYGDDPDVLIEKARESRKQAVEDSNWVVVLSTTTAEIDILLASGRAAQAITVIDSWYPRLARSGFLRPPGIVVLTRGLACNAALLAAYDTKDDAVRLSLIRRAQKEMGYLPTQQLEEAVAWKLVFEVELALMRNPHAEVRPALETAYRIFFKIGLGFGYRPVSAFLGMLGDAAMHRAASDWFQEQKMRDPQRFLVMSGGVLTRMLGWKD